MTVLSITAAASISGAETLGVNVAAATSSKRQVTHDQLNFSQLFTNGTVPAGSEIVVQSLNFAAGEKILDLFAVPGTNGRLINLNGLYLRAVKVTNLSPVYDMTIDHGYADALNWNDGVAEVIPAGGVLFRCHPVTANGWNGPVGTGIRYLRFTSTGAGTDPFTVELLFG